MSEFQIPCEIYARLAPIALQPRHDANKWFQSIRIDNGVAVACNRAILAAEQIGGPGGVFHLVVDPVLIEQCRKEGAFNSILHISLNEMLGFATCKTTLGYTYPVNCAIQSSEPNDFDNWRRFVPTEKLKQSRGVMFWNTEQIALLGQSSPSGRLVFEEFIDTRYATLVRDFCDDRWFGLFMPGQDKTETYSAATAPEWIK